MYVHVFLAPTEGGRGEKNPFEADWMVYRTGILTTTHTVHQAIALKNISENNVSAMLHNRARFVIQCRPARLLLLAFQII